HLTGQRQERSICGGRSPPGASRSDGMTDQDHRTEKQKMLAGELYRAVGDELAADQRRAETLVRAYNATGPDEGERRQALLRDLLGAVGEGAVLRPPFYCDYGYNIRI